MKLFLVLSSVLAAALARPGAVIAPVAYSVFPAAPAAIAAPVSSQYHAQDELGQYSYGYASGLSAKAETKTFDGVTRGGYSFVDAAGKLQSVEYVSDAVNGFRVAASNLPVAPAAPAAPAVALPVPVVDTAEVAEAKAKHLAALEAATSSEAPSTAPPPPPPASPAPEAPAASAAPAAEPAPEAKEEAAAPEAPATPAAVSVAAPKAVAAPQLFAPAAVPYAFAVPGAVTSFTSYSAPVATYTYTSGAFPAVAAYALPAAVAAPEATTKAAEAKSE